MSASAPFFTLRVIAVRSQNPYGRGGAIFTGVEVDAYGQRTDATANFVIKTPSHLLTVEAEPGQIWRVSGCPRPNTIFVNGYRLTESTIVPDMVELIRPSGEHIVTLLAEGKAFVGIGYVKARRLWDHFGEALYQLLDCGDTNRLSEVLSLDASERLVSAWSEWGDAFTLQWLQSKKFPIALGRRVLSFFGNTTAASIEEDPYRLLSFAGSWNSVDTLAIGKFGVTRDDPRRLAGGVEEALYAAFDSGHTCLDRTTFYRRVKEVLGQSTEVAAAVQCAKERFSFVTRGDRFHATGPYVMECAVADAIAQRASTYARLLGDAELGCLIEAYEADASAQIGQEFKLNAQQRNALAVANTWPFAVITGGAGTGKTAVLRALFEVFGAAGHEVLAMALSGRAAKRIREATGHKAQTIAGFLKNFTPETAPQRGVIVIDEASMVDLPSIYRIIRAIPPHFRLVLVGDPHQLAPVGPGLLLHELAQDAGVPVVELTEIRRYRGLIAEAAASIRSGHWPAVPDRVEADIAFLQCDPTHINELVLQTYDEDRSTSRVLSPTRNAMVGGTKALNRACQQRINSTGKELVLWNPEFEQTALTGFRVGDPVICIKNDREIDLQNGSLGVLISVEAPTKDGDQERVLGAIEWDDGKVRELKRGLIENLELAYAITIHKAQGSAFRRVIVPVTKNRLLDRSLLYTAITRAENQVILIGDLDAARTAVLAPRRSDGRQVALQMLLRHRLEAL